MMVIPSNPIGIDDPGRHSMGTSLNTYVSSRIHEWVDEKDFQQIRVVGKYDRSTKLSRKEKVDRPENWQRPTAEQISGDLQINCFPGRAYVFHYASLIATHLALTGRDPTRVSIEIPSDRICREAIASLGYASISSTDVAITASGLFHFVNARNLTDHGSFWSACENIGKHSITWLGVKHSFWGDIAYWLGSELAQCGFGTVIFIGKLGSLRPDHVPNETLAVGDTSVLGNDRIEWTNLFKKTQLSTLVSGKHITLPSVLQESVHWRNEYESKFDFVDREVDNFASGTISGGAKFSYVHLISDNLSKKYKEDLSNERGGSVPTKRNRLYLQIRELLELVLR